MQALRWCIAAGIVLVLLTPFVVVPDRMFPFVVGKALWSRSIIEIVFALWAVLALAQPSYRPPRSWLLIALAAGLGVSLLAALFGVSSQRSLWSTYERMHGVVDLAHWFALAVVLGSMFRTLSEWRMLLTVNLCASLTIASLVVARHLGLDAPFYGALPEPDLPRMGGPFGNPLYLSHYLLVSLFVALGFIVQSCLPAAAGSPASKRRRKSGGGRNPKGLSWLIRLFWAAVAALHFWGFLLAGSAGGVLGLFGGVGFLILAWAIIGCGWRARAAVGVSLVAAIVLLGVLFFGPARDRSSSSWLEVSATNLLGEISLQNPTVQSRLAAWRTGLEGVLERPLLGWGPGNFGTVFGRHASGYGAVIEPHDQAHNQIVETAVTTGAAGLAAYLALWGLAFVVVLRAARSTRGRDRALALFVSAALAAGLLCSQFLFNTAGSALQAMLLLGFAISLEAVAFSNAQRPRLPTRWAAAWTALLRRWGVRGALAVGAVGLSAFGLAVHQSIYAAAHVRHVLTQPSPSPILEEGIEGFEPLANTYRAYLFQELSHRWRDLRDTDPAWARYLLQWAEREAEAFARTEPRNWRIQQNLARLYQAVAETDPEYEATARRNLERALALAPNRAVFPEALLAPDSLEVRPLADGRHELRWHSPRRAAYHALLKPGSDGRWRVLQYVYDPARSSFVPPATGDPGTYRFAIRACRYLLNTQTVGCSARAEWPPFTVPAAKNGPPSS